jgi:hypothetical protein
MYDDLKFFFYAILLGFFVSIVKMVIGRDSS